MVKNNGFVKEYYTGRKDQFDLDYAIFKKAYEQAKDKEEMAKIMEEKFNYVISKIANERAKTLMKDLDLI